MLCLIAASTFFPIITFTARRASAATKASLFSLRLFSVILLPLPPSVSLCQLLINLVSGKKERKPTGFGE